MNLKWGTNYRSSLIRFNETDLVFNMKMNEIELWSLSPKLHVFNC